jgi:hypothetical protein
MSIRIGELLVKAGLLEAGQLEQARNNPKGHPSLEYAVRQGWCDDAAVGRFIAGQYGVPYIDLASFEPTGDALELVPPELLVKHRCLPLELRKAEGILVLALADPSNIYAVDDVRFLTGYNVEVCTAGPVALRAAIERADDYGPLASYASSQGHSLRRTGLDGLREWRVGGAFAFHPGTATVRFLRDGAKHTLGKDVTATSTPIIPAWPCILFTDRELYGPREPVRLGLFRATGAGQRVRVELRSGLSRLPPLEVELDGNGLGWLELPGQLPGSYVLTHEEASASFTVAAHGLSPLHVRWHAGQRQDKVLEGELHAQVLGVPLEGTLIVCLLDAATQPARRVHTLHARTDASGRARVRLPLATWGEASLEVRVEDRESLTATVPLPGMARKRSETVVLCRWGQVQLASPLPFEGSSPLRGLHVGPGPGGESAPLRLVEVTRDAARVELTQPVTRGLLVAVDPGGVPAEVVLRDCPQGHRVEVPVRGPWTLLMAGLLLPRAEAPVCWEGRAALLPPPFPLTLDAPERVRPGDPVALTLRGSPGASAWVSVRDARLTARRPEDAAAAALREDLDSKLSYPLLDGEVHGTLESCFPRERRGRGGVMRDELVYEDAIAGVRTAVREAGAPPSLSEEPPAVVLCQRVTLGEDGVARVGFQAPPLRGPLEVDVFGALGGDCAATRGMLTVHAAVHGELLLPRYVAAGERAAGTLHVLVDAGAAEVEVRRDGVPQVLHVEGRSATRLRLSAPGGEVRFDATAGRFEAEVRADSGEVHRVGGKVEHPGRAEWVERSVVALEPGARLLVVGREAKARVSPGLDVQARRMAKGLQDYSYACAEQTSAILLACLGELMMGSDRRDRLARHLEGLVARLKSMATPEGPFRAYPDAGVNRWLSEAAAWHLLELEGVEPSTSLKFVWPHLQQARAMGQRAAEAHGLKLAPAEPRTPRQALACLRRSPERARELAGRVLAGVGSWEGGLAVLGLGPGDGGDSPYRLGAEVRADTAYGAALLLRAGPEFFSHAVPLVKSALAGLEESGRCYSTLDSVAALALFASLRNLGAASKQCAVDGERVSLEEAPQRTALRSIEALDGPLFVECERVRDEDLDTLLRGDMAGTVRLARTAVGPLKPGEPLELVVRLDGGYCAGDLLQVFLPASLAWLHGGAQARGFALDFEGKDELRVPLVVTGATVDAAGRAVPQRCSVYLRNMYDARRGSAFTALRVETGGAGVLEQRVEGARAPAYLQAAGA